MRCIPHKEEITYKSFHNQVHYSVGGGGGWGLWGGEGGGDSHAHDGDDGGIKIFVVMKWGIIHKRLGNTDYLTLLVGCHQLMHKHFPGSLRVLLVSS